MKKPWSISTAVRNPERIFDFLKILKKLENKDWNKETQIEFQTLLIQNKLYGLSEQFINGLDEKYIKILQKEFINCDEVKEIIVIKNYKDFDMRGRQSFTPIKKLGFAYIDDNKKLKITEIGNYFLKDVSRIDEIFFKSFLKWQLPNLDSDDYKNCDIKPFVAILHLINEVNKLIENPVGISREEFLLFALTILNYKNIKNIAKKIVEYRKNKQNSNNKKQFIKEEQIKYLKEFFETNDDTKIKKELKNLKDYADNVIRYFRITKYIYIRGNGYYIDLEPRRKIEINLLLKNDNASAKKFKSKQEYIDYISNPLEPILFWETDNYKKEIIENILFEIQELSKENNIKVKIENNNIEYLRIKRTELQQKILHNHSQLLEQIEYCKDKLKNIYILEDRALMLEKYITIGFNALNDAIKIKPNYNVGDDNEPTSTASGNKADIECFYNNFNSICEVTMLKDRSQWYNEGQPVMRHLRNFEISNINQNNYCLFIAPSIHRDTLNTFWLSVKYEYEGEKQNIIPITINQFIEMLDILIIYKKNNKNFKHNLLENLYKNIINVNDIDNSNDWLIYIKNVFDSWKKELLC